MHIPTGPRQLDGVAAMIEVFRDWLSAWADFRVEAEVYRELNDERVLVFSLGVGRGKTVDAPLHDRAVA